VGKLIRKTSKFSKNNKRKISRKPKMWIKPLVSVIIKNIDESPPIKTEEQSEMMTTKSSIMLDCHLFINEMAKPKMYQR
jgi:hypothetical protein